MAVPQTQNDWTIHAINIHGLLFERWCQSVVRKSKVWSLKTINYPVEFPRSTGALRGQESSLDIRAEMDKAPNRFVLLMECKKNNPAFVDWVFFRKLPPADKKTVIVSSVRNTPREPPGTGGDVSAQLKTFQSTFPLTDDARETRSDYLTFTNKAEKTKTSNAAITAASYQVALATESISEEDTRFAGSLAWSQKVKLTWNEEYLFPVIVTTARLHICDFSPSDVDPLTGEIAFNKARLTESPILVYEYPLPRHLQFMPAALIPILENDSIEMFMRMHIVVVQSDHLEEFLEKFLETEENEPNDRTNEAEGHLVETNGT